MYVFLCSLLSFLYLCTCANVQRLCGELLCGDRIMYVEKLLRLPLCKWVTSMPRSSVGWTLLKATCARHNRTRGVVVMYMRKVCITKSQRSRVKVKDAVSHLSNNWIFTLRCCVIDFLLFFSLWWMMCISFCVWGVKRVTGGLFWSWRLVKWWASSLCGWWGGVGSWCTCHGGISVDTCIPARYFSKNNGKK